MTKIPNLNRGEHRQISVAILEDDRHERIGLETELRSEPDINVVCITDEPSRFLEVIQDGKVDVSIIDLRIYGDETLGLNVLRKIKMSSVRTKCLVLTNFDDLQRLIVCIDAGAEGFARKGSRPYQQPQLTDLIRTLASGNYYYPPDLVREMQELIDRDKFKADSAEGLIERNPLTKREREVLILVGQKLSDEAIAARLVIGKSTVKQHLENAYNKIGVHERMRAYQAALIKGWLNTDSTEGTEEILV